jgi:hypothetical protein
MGVETRDTEPGDEMNATLPKTDGGCLLAGAVRDGGDLGYRVLADWVLENVGSRLVLDGRPWVGHQQLYVTVTPTGRGTFRVTCGGFSRTCGAARLWQALRDSTRGNG